VAGGGDYEGGEENGPLAWGVLIKTSPRDEERKISFHARDPGIFV